MLKQNICMLKKPYLCLLNRGPLSIPQIVISDSHFNEDSSPQKSSTFKLKQLKFECVRKTLYNFIKFVDETALRCYKRGVCCVIRRSLLGECCAEAPQGAWKNANFSLTVKKSVVGAGGAHYRPGNCLCTRGWSLGIAFYTFSLNFLIPCRSFFFPHHNVT